MASPLEILKKLATSGPLVKVDWKPQYVSNVGNTFHGEVVQNTQGGIGNTKLNYREKNNIVGISRQDIAVDNMQYMEMVMKESKFLKKFKPYLNDDDYVALTMSVESKLLEKDDKKKSEKIYKALVNDLGSRASKVYNLYYSGYFHYFLSGVLEEIQKESDELFYVKGKFATFFETVLKRFKLAFWITSNMKDELIMFELDNRLNDEGTPFFFIYASGPNNIKRLKRVLSNYKGLIAERGYQKLETVYPIRTSKGFSVTIIKDDSMKLKGKKSD